MIFEKLALLIAEAVVEEVIELLRIELGGANVNREIIYKNIQELAGKDPDRIAQYIMDKKDDDEGIFETLGGILDDFFDI